MTTPSWLHDWANRSMRSATSSLPTWPKSSAHHGPVAACISSTVTPPRSRRAPAIVW